MYTTAEDWLDRFVAAGGRMQVDAVTMYPPEEEPVPDAVSTIWREIQMPANADKWAEVEALVRQRTGPISGWGSFPPRS